MTTKGLRKALPIQRDFEKMTIKLEQVIEAIEMSDDFFTSFWDTKTGETVYPADPLLNGETDEVLAAEIENDPKRFLRFPTKYEKYFDLQFVVSGEERFGYVPRDLCKPAMAYDADRDLVFYEEPAESGCIILKAGDFAIVPPEDAHAPRRQTAAGACAVKKIVVKVKV